MNPLRSLVAALTPGVDAHADRTRVVAASLKTLRDDVRSIRRDLRALAANADVVSRHVAQLRLLQQEAYDAGARLDDLARVMDADRVAAHVRAAVERAASLDHPVPRLVMDALWPHDVYDAMVAAIPDPVFFESTVSGAQTLRVPPRLAPVPAIVAWTFIAQIVDDVLVPAVAARFQPVIDRQAASASGAGEATNWSPAAEPGRLVRRPAGSGAPPAAMKPWHWCLIEIDLGGANSAVAVFTPAGPYTPLAPEEGIRHTCEVCVGEPA